MTTTPVGTASDVRVALARAVGEQWVTADVDRFLTDMTEQPPGHADIVVRPADAAEVEAVMRIAAAHELGVTPVVAGYNVAGLTIPRSGGVVLDLTRLDRIVALDREAMVAVIEPGVTFAALKAHLDVHAPELVYAYPFAPPFTSVLANALLDGLTNLSLPVGAMGRWLTGVEAVLADGTVVRTGTGAIVDRWFSRAPLPDLTGLFVSTQGTTGVVTRGGVLLQPAPAHRQRLFAFAYSLDAGWQAMRSLARTRSFDDVGLMTWPAGKLLFGATRGLVRGDDEPVAFVFTDITGASASELAARIEIARDGLGAAGIESIFEADALARLVPRLAKLAELPTTLDFLLDFPGGGLTWVGAYGPGDTWLPAAEAGSAVLERYGFPPFVVARPMDGGHYYVLRFVACFDKRDAREVERVRGAMGELADLVLDAGFVPYKASGDAAARILARAHPGYVALVERVRDALDPHRRMNPGRW
jgi:glycolate oxidase